ncbi:MAG: M23 family metallopeptidase [Deltaproteobacteria bacterium]
MRSLRALSLVGFLLAPLATSCGGFDPNGVEDRDEPEADATLSSALLSSDTESSEALVVSLVAPVRPVTTSDEHVHLVYEFLIQNDSAVSQNITRLDVLGSGRRTPLASLSADTLAASLISNAATGSIEPGETAVVLFDLVFGSDEPLPTRLRHRIQSQGERPAVQAGPIVPVLRERAVRLGPPLRGGGLVDVNGCCGRGEHTSALIPSDAGVFLAQRYAIDFMRVEGISSFRGDASDNASYFIFGDDVIAAAGGRIVAVADGAPENLPGESPPFDLDTALGNYVVEALSDGRFALYAHLQTGSVRVRSGERVQRGQVLGQVGNTGGSTEPHLHFHVMDGPSPVLSNGLPYVFDEFELQGHIDLTGSEAVAVPTPLPQRRENRLPMALDVIAF